ncbi:MAG: sugar ABC transporter permease [Spirochaetales bacterium]|nr:sugar ABC transporter permease [Spirochaetales bacterium]
MLSKQIQKRNIVPYVCLAPFIILFLVFYLFPFIFSFVISLTKWRGTDKMQFVGMNNYTFMLTEDSYFWKSVGNTLWLLIFGYLTQHLIALPLAIIINNRLIKGKTLFKTIYFIPYITGSVAISIVWGHFYNENFGIINYFLELMGLDRLNFFEAALVPIKIAIVVAWRNIGWNVALYLAGLQAIPKELYEAVSLEGASTYYTHTRITLPLLLPVIFFAVTMSIIGGLQAFDEPFMLTGGFGFMGGSGNTGFTLAFYVMWLLQRRSNLGGGTAITWMVSLFVMLLAFINSRITRIIDPGTFEHKTVKKTVNKNKVTEVLPL